VLGARHHFVELDLGDERLGDTDLARELLLRQARERAKHPCQLVLAPHIPSDQETAENSLWGT